MKRGILSAVILLTIAANAIAQQPRSAGRLQDAPPNTLPAFPQASRLTQTTSTSTMFEETHPTQQPIQQESDHIYVPGPTYAEEHVGGYTGSYGCDHGFFHRHMGCPSDLGYGCCRPHYRHFAKLHCVTNNFKQRCTHMGDRCLQHLRPILMKPFSCAHDYGRCYAPNFDYSTVRAQCGHTSLHGGCTHWDCGQGCGYQHRYLRPQTYYRPRVHLPRRWWGMHSHACCDPTQMNDSCCKHSTPLTSEENVAPPVPAEPTLAPISPEETQESKADTSGEILLPPAPEPITKETRLPYQQKSPYFTGAESQTHSLWF